MATVTGDGLPQAEAPFRFGRTASAPATPTRAAPPADPATSHRLIRGSSRHDDRLATTSRASDRAPAATHAQADPGSAAGRCSAVSAPSPRATSRAPRARPNTRAARSSAATPTHGRAGTEGQARAARPSATRPAATARAPRRSSAATAVELTCARPSSMPARTSPGRYAPDDHNRRSPSARSPAATAGDQAQPGRDAVHPPVLVPEGRLEPAPGEVWDCAGWKSASESAFGLGSERDDRNVRPDGSQSR